MSEIRTLSTVEEIKKAVDSGQEVYSDTLAYRVIKDQGQYLIKCTLNGYCIGLTGQAGTAHEDTLNGTDFFTIK